MATYIPGIQDYIPQIQPFKPDFNFFQSALEHKQQQYQAGYNKISSIYGQLLNAELLREPNKERRDSLFTQIDSDIKRLSGVDLSLQENVYEASKLFQPLIDNPYFRKDVAFTKQYNGQLRRADALKSNPDPKSDERWWQEGEAALRFQAEDFSKSSDDQSLRFQNPSYTPFIDTTTKLFKFASDNNINPESLSFDSGFIFKHTNGQKAIPRLQNVFSSILLSDPRVQAMTYTQSYLDRKNYMRSNAVNFNGDEYAAETQYLNDKLAQINEYYKTINNTDEQVNTAIVTKKRVIEQKIQNEGIDPDLDKDLVAMYQNLTADSQVQTSVLDKNKSVLTQTEGFDVNTMDREALRYRVDNALSYFQIDNLANRTAESYALAKEKIDYQANPYTLEKVKFGYSKALQDSRFEQEKFLKIMDIAAEALKNGGNGVPGQSLNIGAWEGIPFKIPGPGNVATGVDLQQRTASVISETEEAALSAVMANAQNVIQQQNAIIADPSKTPAEKAAADQVIRETLVEYQIAEKSPAITKKEYGDLTDQGTLIDAAKAFGGLSMIPGIQAVPSIQAVPILGPIITAAGLAGKAVTGAAGLIGGPGLAGQGAKNLYGEIAGQEVTTPETITKTKGLAIKEADGKWKLADRAQLIGLLDPDSPEYYNETNKRITQYASDYVKLNPKDPNGAKLKAAIDGRTEYVNEQQKLLQGGREIFVQNNKIIASAMAGEVGTSSTNAGLYLSEDGTRARTENEFIAAYIKANKDNYEDYPPNTFNLPFSSRVRKTVSGTPDQTIDEDRLEDMTDDAQDLYEELTEAYQTLSKNPDGSLQLKSAFAPSLVNSMGINAYFGTAKMFDFDAANYASPGYQMLMDFYRKDFSPAVASKTFMDDAGVKVVFGNGFDVTKDEYEDMDSDQGAINAIKGFMASSSMNYGGKTGENQQRPTGRYYLHALAANDGNKVAITLDVDPTWINKNAGEGTGADKEKGIAYDIQKHFNETGNSSVTFFMDADKAQSIGFTSMQSTPKEMLTRMNGKLDLNTHSEMGGEVTLTPDEYGNVNYSGYYKTVDELGGITNNSIFGSVATDINAAAEYWNELFKATSTTNMDYLNTLKNNSQNKVYDPNALLGNAE